MFSLCTMGTEFVFFFSPYSILFWDKMDRLGQTEAMLTLLHRLKTGAMIAGAAELGCVAAEMPAEKRAQAVEYAAQLGLAFQIRDDMLDVVGNEQELGKPIGSDREEGKLTFVDLCGLENAAAW